MRMSDKYECNHGMLFLRCHQKCNCSVKTKRGSQAIALHVSVIHLRLLAYLRGEEVDVAQAKKLRERHKHEKDSLWILDCQHKAIVNAAMPEWYAKVILDAALSVTGKYTARIGHT